jgi:hypothetical protein
MWDLIPFNVSIPLGGSYDDVLPGWGTGELVSASTALIIDSTPVQLTAAPAFLSQNYSGMRFTLDSSSLSEVTDQVSEDGRIHLDFPSVANGTEYQLFAYYQNHTIGLAQQSPLYLNTTIEQSPVTSFLQNGSRFNSHFDVEGAQLVIDFWEKYLLDYNNTRELIREVGNYGWEDSYEFGNSILVWWTPALVDAFQKARGYSIKKYLPLIYYPNAQSDAPLASPHWYQTDDDDKGQAHVDDYRQTVSFQSKIGRLIHASNPAVLTMYSSPNSTESTSRLSPTGLKSHSTRNTLHKWSTTSHGHASQRTCGKRPGVRVSRFQPCDRCVQAVRRPSQLSRKACDIL